MICESVICLSVLLSICSFIWRIIIGCSRNQNIRSTGKSLKVCIFRWSRSCRACLWWSPRSASSSPRCPHSKSRTRMATSPVSCLLLLTHGDSLSLMEHQGMSQDLLKKYDHKQGAESATGLTFTIYIPEIFGWDHFVLN